MIVCVVKMSLRNLVTVPRYPGVVKVKVNIPLVQAMQNQRRSRDIALFIFNLYRERPVLLWWRSASCSLCTAFICAG